MPLVSIVMPAYNCADFISASIESVRSQTFEAWELIIVDDCSTDGTASAAAQFLDDVRVKLLKNKENLGGAASRNRAIEVACGRYIAFLDADDLWAPDKLALQLAFMQANQVGFTFTGYSTTTENGAVTGTIKVPAKVSFHNLLKHNYIGCLTAIYDTEPYGKFFMPLVRKRQDFALWLELLKKFDFAYGLQENLGFYRVRSGSLSASKVDAFKYYWLVLRRVGGCNVFSAGYNIAWYLFIVCLKKYKSSLYHRIFIGQS